jgi:hypothetical protein
VNHPIDEDLSPGAPVNHPIDEDLSLGARVFAANRCRLFPEDHLSPKKRGEPSPVVQEDRLNARMQKAPATIVFRRSSTNSTASPYTN